jgi:GH15 family glucan-1,4-alpha-glucosidase
MNEFGLDVGCNRLAAIAQHLGMKVRAAYWSDVASGIQSRLLKEAWSEKRGAFTAATGVDELDASVLLLPDIGLMEASDPRFVQTVDAIEHELVRGNHVMRYAGEDDFGVPESAFLVCRFWLIDAWWKLGRREKAIDMFTDALRYRNRYGLLAEDLHLRTNQLCGNLILTAMRLSRSWEDRYWHD